MTNKVIRILQLIQETSRNVVIDNDFEAAYSMPTGKFKEYKKDELVEALYVMEAILSENNIDLREIYD